MALDPDPPDPAGDGTSLYVHVPFCVVKCGYCDFTSYAIDDPAVHDRFLQALAGELRVTALPQSPTTAFIGGGTPSHLSADRLRELFRTICGYVDLSRCAEVTMEANPESVDEEKAGIALEAGVRRISMGVQSFDAARLRFLDRAHTADRAKAAFRQLRSAGAENVSIDLIFGLPGQRPEEWRQDLTEALELGPDHLSCYSLTFEPGTRLRRDLDQGLVERVDEEADREMFSMTREVLESAGFRAYEISNFAGRGGPCRHNDHYWLQGDYVGVGPGASSHRRGVRSTNLKAIDTWARSALAGIPPVASAETLTPAQRIGEALWLGIRRTDGVDLGVVEARVGFPVRDRVAPVLERHLRSGLVRLDGDRLSLTAAGLLVADTVGADLLVLPSDAERQPVRQHLG